MILLEVKLYCEIIVGDETNNLKNQLVCVLPSFDGGKNADCLSKTQPKLCHHHIEGQGDALEGQLHCRSCLCSKNSIEQEVN